MIVRYKNEPFLMFLQKVSLKSHRSIINYPFGEFMSRKAGIKVEKCLLFLLNKVHGLVSWCPLHGHLETMYWASREHVLGTGCPHHGHRVPNVWTVFGRYISKLRCNYALALNVAFVILLWCFYYASMIHSVILYAAFMILLWYFYDTLCKFIRKVSFVSTYWLLIR